MKIYLDMDGVLVDFQRPALARHGIYYNVYPKECGWDIVAACNLLKPGCNMTPARFWKGVEGKDFWANLPKTSLCDPLIDRLRWEVGGLSNVCILSSCEVEGSSDGKRAWIKANLPAALHDKHFFGRPKEFVANPGDLLIDDYDGNIDKWIAAGGIGLLVPAQWNRLHDIRTPDQCTLRDLIAVLRR